MLHIEYIKEWGGDDSNFVKRASGRYYTGEVVGRRLAKEVAMVFHAAQPSARTITVVDPFGGDGRLLVWLLDAWGELGFPKVQWDVALWDLHDIGFRDAKARLTHVSNLHNHKLEVSFQIVDAFVQTLNSHARYDLVITNPPWELLKPDSRELAGLAGIQRKNYIAKMRAYDEWLATKFPLSQPKRKFAGWGTNLSRVGLEASLSLVRPGGIVGAVLPASFLADDQTASLREHVLTAHTLLSAAFYSAEAKLYESADTASIAISLLVGGKAASKLTIGTHSATTGELETSEIDLDREALRRVGFVMPISFGAKALTIINGLAQRFTAWRELESDATDALWAGREIDETRISEWLQPADSFEPLFVKGRMIGRYKTLERPSLAVKKANWSPPPSTMTRRIAWRDVSRPSQKRRMIATLIESGSVAGNSLGVAYFRDFAELPLLALLGVMNSTCFEFQLRAHLATGHVSLSSLRKVAVPCLQKLREASVLASLVRAAIDASDEIAMQVDAYVARVVYEISEDEYKTILNGFTAMTPAERYGHLAAYHGISTEFLMRKESMLKFGSLPIVESSLSCDILQDQMPTAFAAYDSATMTSRRNGSGVIPNHFAPRLSELDMRMVVSVPEGGNWKDIPESIPSKRLEQIRESFKRGEGSRSTYYGRLKRNDPAFTISTYFSRPGNGCHIHYGQDRVLSPREAARLQSFPDSFEFLGSQTAVNTQIGNAVPPLLAYQIAKTLGQPGVFVDLFAGAGGMGLGFKWAGWKPVIANDIQSTYLATYAKNVHDNVLVGSIANSEIFEKLLEAALSAKQAGVPFWVLGGPPCQGFSTAGNQRSMEDPRNHLAWDYVRFLGRVQPDGFVFENVTGLLNMDGGRVFTAMKEAFSTVMPTLMSTVLSTECFAIPQRRKRVILVGMRNQSCPEGGHSWHWPAQLTALQSSRTLFTDLAPAISVRDALDDLPSLKQGEDGSNLPYRTIAATPYQAFMRGLLTASDYLKSLVSANS